MASGRIAVVATRRPGELTVPKSRLEELLASYAIRDGSRFSLADVDPDDTGNTRLTKGKARDLLSDSVDRIRRLQEKLYAQDRWGVLLIFQGLDAAGKDGAIEHVLSGVNPQGCQVALFREPSEEELDHDFLWRCQRRLPERGRIGVFNRSWYEEVLVVRVRPELLQKQKLPASLVRRGIWNERLEDIAAYERYLARNGYLILKFFLHISREEQLSRFEKRLTNPEKHWKFSLGDVEESERWHDYEKAYEEAIRRTAAPHAPWVVVPANRKWFARLVVAAHIIDALEGLDLAFPALDEAGRAELANGRKLVKQVRSDLGRPKPRNKRRPRK